MLEHHQWYPKERGTRGNHFSKVETQRQRTSRKRSIQRQAANDDESEPPINTVMDIKEVDEWQREIRGTSQDEMVEAEVQESAETDDDIKRYASDKTKLKKKLQWQTAILKLRP